MSEIQSSLNKDEVTIFNGKEKQFIIVDTFYVDEDIDLSDDNIYQIRGESHAILNIAYIESIEEIPFKNESDVIFNACQITMTGGKVHFVSQSLKELIEII